MKSLYELTAEALQLAEALDQSGGELTPELEAWFDRNAADLAAKADGYLALVRTYEMHAAQARAERDQWAEKERAAEAAADRLKARLKAHLERTGTANLVTAAGRVVSLAKNGGAVPLVIDETQPVPDEFLAVKVVKSLNREAVRDALERGEPLPFARFGERTNRLVIR